MYIWIYSDLSLFMSLSLSSPDDSQRHIWNPWTPNFLKIELKWVFGRIDCSSIFISTTTLHFSFLKLFLLLTATKDVSSISNDTSSSFKLLLFLTTSLLLTYSLLYSVISYSFFPAHYLVSGNSGMSIHLGRIIVKLVIGWDLHKFGIHCTESRSTSGFYWLCEFVVMTTFILIFCVRWENVWIVCENFLWKDLEGEVVCCWWRVIKGFL